MVHRAWMHPFLDKVPTRQVPSTDIHDTPQLPPLCLYEYSMPVAPRGGMESKLAAAVINLPQALPVGSTICARLPLERSWWGSVSTVLTNDAQKPTLPNTHLPSSLPQIQVLSCHPLHLLRWRGPARRGVVGVLSSLHVACGWPSFTARKGHTRDPHHQDMQRYQLLPGEGGFMSIQVPSRKEKKKPCISRR